MVNKADRKCSNCSHWEPEFFVENYEELAGYCESDGKLRLVKESQTCDNHRYRRGSKNEEYHT